MPLLVPILLVHSTLGNASPVHGLDLCNKDCSLQSFVGCKYSKSCFCLFSLRLPLSGFGVVPYLSVLRILSAVFPFFVTIRYILATWFIGSCWRRRANPVLAMVVPVCMALPALPHNHPLVPHLYPIQRLHSLGALSSSLPYFLSSRPLPDPSFFCTFTKMMALLTCCHFQPSCVSEALAVLPALLRQCSSL